jgi:predicted RNA-binding protein
MKTTTKKSGTIVCAAFLTAAMAGRAVADAAAPAGSADKSYTGMVTAVDLKEHTVELKGLLFSKRFNLGDACQYRLLDKNAGTASDLRPGEKITVAYQNSSGVLVADRIEQVPLCFKGMVKAIAPDHHTLTVHEIGLDKTFQLADNCDIQLRNEQPGTLADVQLGNYVTVTYEVPAGTPTAREIAQTSESFAGTLTAIDLGERTVKAKTLFDTKKFNLADNCAIVINGRTDGKLRDLKPDDKLVFSYDEIDGVNVVNRIALDNGQTHSDAVGLTKTGSPD